MTEYLARLNPEQRLAVETVDGPLLVLAGAGTGKTRVLTTRFAHILITQTAYQDVQAYFAGRQPEAACLLLGPKNDSIITHLLADEDGRATPSPSPWPRPSSPCPF